MNKIIKIILITLLLAIIVGVTLKFTVFKKVTTVITLSDDLTFDYNDEVYLFDTISIIDGQILTENYLLDTEHVGVNVIEIEYNDSNKFKQKYQYTIEIVDNIDPLLSVSSNTYAEVGSSEKDALKYVFCGDNADREVSIKIEGDYDLNTIGSYPVTIIASDDSNNTVSRDTTIHVHEKRENGSGSNNTNKKGVDINYFFKNYKDDSNSIGLDLSVFQEVYDFNLVKEAGIEFVMLRIGWGPNSDLTMNTDNNFEDFYRRAKEAGLKVGAYFFSYATTLDEVDLEVEYVDSMLKDKDIDLWVSYDWENWHLFKDCKMNFVDLNKMAKKFMDGINAKGYKAMNYGSKYYLETIWTLEGYDTWLAHYNDETDYAKPFNIWQISDKGKVPGIVGLADVDILIKE